MHVLLSTYGSCGDVESSVGLAVLAVQVRGRRIVGAGVRRWRRPVRPLVTGSGPPSTADQTRRAPEVLAAQRKERARVRAKQGLR